MKIRSHLAFIKEVLNPVSPSFCAAKWLNATIWLNSGMTSSCHHPTPHHIPRHELEKSPAALHNTLHKKEQRRMMIEGTRPEECEYCWKIEDMGKDHISDRVFKSEIYEDKDLQRIAKLPITENVNPKTLEIAFDRVCNFACAYCSPHFSSTWVNDLKQNGPYRMLDTDKFTQYVTTQDSANPFDNQTNPYIEAFWKWWPDLKQELEQLRITGGEPLLSPNVWRVLEELAKDDQFKMKLALNSNLGAPEKTIQRFIDLSQKIQHLEIYTSNESFDASAEYLRDGMQWQTWKATVEKVFTEANLQALHIMMTISGLSLFTMDQFLDQIMIWKLQSKIPIRFSVNILRHPTFHSPLAVPRDLRLKIQARLSHWLEQNRKSSDLIDFEIESLQRLIDYLEFVEVPTKTAEPQPALEQDLKRFLIQFDKRRNKNFRQSFPAEVVQWMDKVQD